MTLTISDVRLDRPLTKAEEQAVRAYIESIVSKRSRADRSRPMPTEDLDVIGGMFAGLAPEKSDVELADEAKDVMFAKDARLNP